MRLRERGRELAREGGRAVFTSSGGLRGQLEVKKRVKLYRNKSIGGPGHLMFPTVYHQGRLPCSLAMPILPTMRSPMPGIEPVIYGFIT